MTRKEKLFSFILTVAVIALDQLSKFAIVANVPKHTVWRSFFGDFLRIIHVRNLGVAFSVGYNLPDSARALCFRILPLIALAIIIAYYLKSQEWTRLQGWSLAGILGGGFGNLIDRFLRPDGVVDFIDVKFYGIFGLERWPTFNVADATVVVCGALFIIGYFKSAKIKENKD